MVRVVNAAHCAACFCSKPDVPHVDFNSDYDGPTLLDASGQRQQIDELIVCQDCLREAFQALELSANPTGELERELHEARSEVQRWRAYAEGLEDAQASRPEPVKRGRGRPPRREPRPEPKPEPVPA
jgi:hypothetical protein